MMSRQNTWRVVLFVGCILAIGSLALTSDAVTATEQEAPAAGLAEEKSKAIADEETPAVTLVNDAALEAELVLTGEFGSLSENCQFCHTFEDQCASQPANTKCGSKGSGCRCSTCGGDFNCFPCPQPPCF